MSDMAKGVGPVSLVPMHIGFYAPALPDSGVSNGIVTYTKIMRNSLLEHGHRVTVVTPDHIEQDGTISPLPRTNSLIRRWRHWTQHFQPSDGADAWPRLRFFEAFAAARQSGVDVFEMEESFGWAAKVVGKGVPIVERLHGPHLMVRDDVESPEQKCKGHAREAAELISFTKVDAITSPTQRLLDELERRCQIDLHPSRVIPNPIPPVPQSELWQASQADPDQLIFVGRVDRCKGADIVLHAFARALQRCPSLKLVVVGPNHGITSSAGVERFDDYVRRELSPEARERIHYAGILTADEIAKVRRRSAVSVTASRFENFPYSIAEAMIMGMPIITTDTYGGTELIRRDRDGLVTRVGHIDEMANAMLALRRAPGLAAALGRSAVARATEWLSPSRIAMQALELYQEVRLRGAVLNDLVR